MAEIYIAGWDISNYKNTLYKIQSVYRREFLIGNAKRGRKYSRGVVYNGSYD